jgi:hypothetical protein
MNDRSHVHERPWLRPLVVICSDMQQSIYISCVFLLCLGSKRHCRSPAFPYQEQYIPLGLGQPIHNLSPHLIQPLSSCLQSIPVPFVRPQISISPTERPELYLRSSACVMNLLSFPRNSSLFRPCSDNFLKLFIRLELSFTLVA